MANRFVWYELMTTDLDAARDFYAAVVGWTGAESSQSPERYVVMSASDSRTAGLMPIPELVLQNGGRPMWLGYIGVEDIDSSAAKLKQAGGTVKREPAGIPGIGRFAVVTDPQGATFMLFQPEGGSYTPPAPMAPGSIGWHELYAADGSGAFDFYAGQFGWTKGEAMDMGAMGTYQLVAMGAEPIGAIMNKPAEVPAPFWNFYFAVPSIEAAAGTVRDKGGQVLMGPHEVPGGAWVIQGRDPQGAQFALVGGK